MRVVLSGGEKGSYRSVLVANDVKRIAVNLTQLAIPKKKELNIKDLVGGADVYLYTSDSDTDVAGYDEFIRLHAEELTCVIGRPDYDGSWLGDKYFPLWNDPKDPERLAHLMEKYGRVAISDSAVTSRTMPRIRQLQARWGASLIGITSKADVIDKLPWTAVIVTSWTSVIRYGETQIWDGHGLRRYPAQQKQTARKKHRGDIVKLGVDYDEVLEDDTAEVAKLAIRSWLEWEMHNYGKDPSAAYDPLDDDDENEFEDLEEGEVVTTTPKSTSLANTDSTDTSVAIQVPTVRHENERKLLPVMGIETMIHTGTTDGESTEINPEPVTLIRSGNNVLRRCDSCYLADRCPAFKEHAECAYKLPVELRTKEQLQAVIQAMIEMQTSRVLFGRFAEEMEGQGMDPTLSAEMDRLFRLIQQSKDIADTNDLVRINIEARGQKGSVISSIFGTSAGQQAQQLAHPMTSKELDAVVSPIIDGEVIDD